MAKIDDSVKKKVPELRFKGFTDEWEERKLSTESTITAGGDIDKSKLKEVGEYPILANALTNDGIVGYYDSSYRVEAPAVTVTGRGDVGHAKARKVNFTPVVRLLSVKSKHDVDFLENAINNHKVLVESTGVPQLTAPQLGNYKIFFPTGEEQEKIGSFFKQLDDTIALHQHKLDLLKEQKKGYLQKMFPKNGAKVPELRFAGFADDWEERKLSELATMNARIGWQNLRTSEFLDNGDYMLITGTDFKAGAIDYSNIHYVEKERFEQDKKIQISNKSILITKDGTIGKVAYVEGLTMPATLNAGVFNVKVKEDLAIDSKYLFHYLKAPFLLKFADQRSTGGTIKHLNQNVLVEFPIPLPSLGEQHKIAGLLSNFDNTIALHQRKLDLLKEQKKGFLQKMFV
ncbi:restriction endonuclease subunit S [Lactococcus lactis]|uniref:restriction endonuclease subunit S n=1 Tax=Lactococcus lactis TaxID=1358 RepID=UPI002890C589|nr:restriction endonuclease subunit S [Lactococcus lactis]MDT2901431.1 restriction endonuclease subunit S [Lactococcus lactis]